MVHKIKILLFNLQQAKIQLANGEQGQKTMLNNGHESRANGKLGKWSKSQLRTNKFTNVDKQIVIVLMANYKNVN